MKYRKKPSVVIDEVTNEIKIDKRIGLRGGIILGSAVGFVVGLYMYQSYRIGIEHAIYNTMKAIEEGSLTFDIPVKEGNYIWQ